MLTEQGFEPVFDGSTLAGWRAIPRRSGRLCSWGPDLLAESPDHS
jgi:hypothetical protein